jgi:hypothetical protein
MQKQQKEEGVPSKMTRNQRQLGFQLHSCSSIAVAVASTTRAELNHAPFLYQQLQQQ